MAYLLGQPTYHTRKQQHYFYLGVVLIFSHTVPDMVIHQGHHSQKQFLPRGVQQNMIISCLKGLKWRTAMLLQRLTLHRHAER